MNIDVRILSPRKNPNRVSLPVDAQAPLPGCGRLVVTSHIVFVFLAPLLTSLPFPGCRYRPVPRQVRYSQAHARNGVLSFLGKAPYPSSTCNMPTPIPECTDNRVSKTLRQLYVEKGRASYLSPFRVLAQFEEYCPFYGRLSLRSRLSFSALQWEEKKRKSKVQEILSLRFKLGICFWRRRGLSSKGW